MLERDSAASVNNVEGVPVSIVIPVFNAGITLERCLKAISGLRGGVFELIIIDNGSADNSADIIERWRRKMPFAMRLVREEKKGAAAARNSGVRAAKGEWIAFTDADCEPEADWIETGRKLIAAKKPQAMVGPAWGTLEGGVSAKLLGLTTLSVGLPEHWAAHAGDTGTHGFATANFWICKKLFEAVGGFDEMLTISGEDYDLCGRICRHGERILYTPSLCVQHHHTDGVAGMLAKAARYGQAHGMLFERYGEPGIYLDWVGGQRLCFASRRKIWVNMVSAEKKSGVLLLLSIVHPIFLVTWLLYPLLPAVFLARRLRERGERVHFAEVYGMAWLLIIRSAAFTLGRIRGSKLGVWLA
jgi:glycosyltransferase involved in cell wall biosynthesis